MIFFDFSFFVFPIFMIITIFPCKTSFVIERIPFRLSAIFPLTDVTFILPSVLLSNFSRNTNSWLMAALQGDGTSVSYLATRVPLKWKLFYWKEKKSFNSNRFDEEPCGSDKKQTNQDRVWADQLVNNWRGLSAVSVSTAVFVLSILMTIILRYMRTKSKRFFGFKSGVSVSTE